MTLYQQLQNFGRVKANEPLAKHTTFKIGGPAEFLVIVEDTNKLVELLRFLDSEGVPRFILGGGSNMLASDEGYKGVVIKIKTQQATVLPTGIQAEAGCITVAIAQLSMQNGFTGFEWGVGVPGTIGGAVRGNAGAMGGEMKDSVTSVTVYQDGEVVEMSGAECEFGYRDSIFKRRSLVVLSVTLTLAKTDNNELAKKALEYLQYRNKTQPQGFASTGCIFKNITPSEWGIDKADLLARFPDEAEKIAHFFSIDKISAGWLVEQSGMKGAAVGKAAVSDKHGNFVVNLGEATATEVTDLIEQIKSAVHKKSGIDIEEEIQII